MSLSLFIRPEKAEKIEQTIGYEFKNRKFLTNAFSHSSFVNEKHLSKSDCNERMEFLGDAVLELATSEFLFNRHKDMQEGELTKLRARLVCEPALAYSAREIGLSDYLLLGHGGAIYLDGGLTNAKEFIEKYVLNDIEHKKLFFDSKTIFQEMVQSDNMGTISYKLLAEYGPDHDKKFKEAVYIGEKEYGVGEGHTKKAAEQVAAYNGILKLKAESAEGGLCT